MAAIKLEVVLYSALVNFDVLVRNLCKGGRSVFAVSIVKSSKISVVLAGHGGAVQRVVADEDGLPVVQTGVGTIRGLRAEDGDYSMFMGIPYAQIDPDNPFGESRPYPHFETTFDAVDDLAICPQREEFQNTIVGTLDCLHINVYVPDSASDVNRLPVFVWIFGGGFSIGFAGRYLYGPSFLVRHDVILVTINYRLGPYGFMCLDIPEVPGNQGFKDQVLALRWIRDNIEAFGGDNSRITIGGNSAGGMSADFHLYYGQDENLFHKIVPQSGVVLVEGIVGNPNPEAPLKLAEFLGFTSSDVKDALSFISTVRPEQLIVAVEESEVSFGPCVENKFDGVDNFITELPLNIEIPRVKDVEVLIGLNNDEMYHAVAALPDMFLVLIDFVQLFINSGFNFENNTELYTEMHNIVTNFYYGNDAITPERRQTVTDFTSDFYFNHPILRTVKKYLENGVQTMYLYMFSYSGGRNFSKNRLNLTGGGASHADELGYLFDISYMERPLEPEDQLIVDRMTQMWANFVKYGNPTPEPTELVPVLWQPVSQDQWHYLELDSTVRVGTRPLHQRMAFLDLFFKANEEYRRGYNREEEVEAEESEESEPEETNPEETNPEETNPEEIDPEEPGSGETESEEDGEPDSASSLVLDISLPLLTLILTYIQL